MAILITAEAILDKLKDRFIAAKEWEIESAKNHNNELVNRAQAAQAAFVEVALTVKAMPTVDAVEVVRCKDCKHRPVMVWSEVYDDFDVLAPEVDGKEDWRCPCLVEDDPYYSWSPNDNWFCANGERRVTDGVCK